MKKLLLIITLIYTSCMFGQILNSVPAGINYQAIIRDNTTGSVLSNSVVTLKFDLYNTIGSSINYSESKTFTTNIAGLITHTIGSGSATIGTNIYDVYWEGGDVHYEVTLTLGGTTTIITPKQKFMSVPYALHSADGIIWQGNKNSNITGATATFLPLGSVYRNRNTGITYYKTNNGSYPWDTLALSNGNGPWLRNPIGSIDNVYLGNSNDYVSIGLPTATSANEKLHLHNNTGDAYMQLTTLNTSNNVGFVFGRSGDLNKGVITFDNYSSSLTYKLFGKRKMMIEGATGEALFGHIPIGAASNAAFTIFDSTDFYRPALSVLNIGGLNSILRIGTSGLNSMDFSYEKSGAINVLKLNSNSGTSTHATFKSTGEFYPGSDGSTGQAFIKAGPTTSDPIVINSANSNSVITHVGYTKLGNNGLMYPEIQVLEFFGTMPNTAGSAVSIGLTSYIPSPDKIVSVSIYANDGLYSVPPGYTLPSLTGYEFYYLISSSYPDIIITTTNLNSGNILNKPFRALVTIKK